MKKKRDVNFDLLRIIACIAVVIIHVNSKYLLNSSINTEFYILEFYTSFVRSAVLLFIMISGAYLLDPKKELTLKKLYSKYVPRIIISLVLFNSLYIAYYYFFVNNSTNILGYIKLCLLRTIRGDVSGIQFWYLYIALFLYIITPALRIFTKNATKEEYRYILIIGFIFTIFYPTLVKYSIFKQIDFHNYYAYQMGAVYSFGYTFYYILGYYIKKYVNISKKYSLFIFAVGLVLTFTLVAIICTLENRVDITRQYSYFTTNIFLMAIGAFMFFNNVKINSKYNSIIEKVANLTFGVYLIHTLLIAILVNGNVFGSINPLLGTPIITIGVFLVSLLISFLLNKIPILKKYVL